MTKFTPLDLQPYANAGREPEGWHPAIAAELANLPAGKQAFWGIPFELLTAAGQRWLVLEPGGPPVTIPLSGTASYVLVAHFCDEPRAPAGGDPSRNQPAARVAQPGGLGSLRHASAIPAAGG